MKTTPILFSGPMVRAILDGRKTVTRRVVKPQPNYVNKLGIPFYPDGKGPVDYRLCPYGTTGDQIWVKETFGCIGRSPKDGPPPKGEESTTVYRATSTVVPHVIKWRPSIHMPRWASRLTLEIVSVRVERLQDMTEEDAKNEGLDFVGDGAARWGVKGLPDSWGNDPRQSFRSLWESINGPGSWERNDWVWVVEFRRHKP